MTSPSWQDIYDVGQYALQARRPTLLVNPGDVSDGFLVGTASMCDVVIGDSAGKFRSTYLDGAEGEGLTEEARDRGVERDTGDEAIGQVTFSRPTAAAGAGTITAGYTTGTQPDVNGAFASFVTTQDAVFGALELTKTVTARCTVKGPSGNVEAGTIARMLATAFDATITVTNAARFAGGANVEADEDLRDRTRGFFLTQARATEAAVIYGAKTVSGVERASVIVDQDTGVVTLYVADADGNANAAMVAAVEAVMPDWAPIGAIVVVVGATLVYQSIALQLTVRAGVDINALLDRIRAAVVSRVGRLQPGETLYRDMISAAVRDVDRVGILEVVVVTPAANVAPATGEVLRTSTGLISFP